MNDLEQLEQKINELIEEKSIARKIFTRTETREIPLESKDKSIKTILPKVGYIGQNFDEEDSGYFLYIPSFELMASSEEEDEELIINEIVERVCNYEEECAFRTLVAAATHNINFGKISVPPIYQMPSGDSAAGYLSKELINRMIVGMKRLDRNLSILLVGNKEMDEIRSWTDKDINPDYRKELLDPKFNTIWNVNLLLIENLNTKWNINDNKSQYYPFKGGWKDNNFNDYEVVNGRIFNNLGDLVREGETQIYGIDTKSGDLLMYAERFYLFKNNPRFYGTERIGMSIIDSRSVSMGVINRNQEEKQWTKTN